MSRNKLSIAVLACGALLALGPALAAQETAKPVAPAAAPAKTPKGTTTASLNKPANELPDANAENDQANTVGVAAIVNDSIISDYDVRQRVALLGATSGVRATNEEQRKALRSQVLRQLETEKMQVQEANRKKIQVTSEEVDKAIENLTKENNLTVEKLKEVLGGSGVHISTLRSQIAVQIAWQRSVQDEFGDQIRMKPGEVDQEFARVKAGANKPHYLVAEIFLGVDNPEQDGKVKADADRIHQQIVDGAPFNTIARQFSQSPSAASGGDLGAIEDGQMAPELNAAVEKMKVGEISLPIRSSGGYYILFLRRRWEPVGTKVSTEDENKPATNATKLMGMLFPIGPKPAPELVQRVTQIANQIKENVVSCQNLDRIAASMRGVQMQDFGKMGLRLTDLSEEMQSAVAKTGPGRVTDPFQIQGIGIEIIARCDAAPAKIEVWQAPTRDQVEDQLFQEKIAGLARGYLARLRRNADVQDR
ncbi:MAG TPA: peptidylprolyl isomerase [Rhizomicrobium sp.]|nr:peptidylprolyl isomerase [Rhizomicrobium sp.]